MMAKNRNNLLWGIVLIVMGGLFLLQTLGLVPVISQTFWAVSMGVACLFFIGAYLYAGVENWPWLFPIFITGGLALVAGLSFTPINGVWIGSLFMAAISFPFWIIYLLDRNEHWWALIPGWATAVIALVILVSEQWAGETVGALVMWGIALPFIVVYLRNREHWWALIPGFIMGGMGFIVLLAGQGSDDIIGTMVLLIVALPFFAVFFFAKDQWWAIIPAGILSTIAMIIPFASNIEEGTFGANALGAAIFLGIAAPFAWLWLRHERYDTAWARYPAIGLVGVSIFTLLLGTIIDNSWPIILIIIGGWLLYDNLRSPKLKS